MLSRFHCVRLYAMLWTAACQIPPSMGFSRQECRSGLLFPPPGDLPDPGVESASLVSSALAGGFFTTEKPGKPKGTLVIINLKYYCIILLKCNTLF